MIEGLRDEGVNSLMRISEKLNERGISAPKGGEWTAVQVSRVLVQGRGAVKVVPTISPTPYKANPP